MEVIVSDISNVVSLAEYLASSEKIASPSLPSDAPAWEWKKLHVGTNTLYKATNILSGKAYVVKVYNKCSKIDHALELSVIEHLAKVGKHPMVIYSTDEYRIEEFVESPVIDIFKLRIPYTLLKVVELISSLHNDLEMKNEILPLIKDKRPFIVKVYESWLSDFKRSYNTIKLAVEGSKYESLISNLGCLFKEEFQRIFSSLLPQKGELVLSHNDISPANLLYAKFDNKTKPEMCLIDYEYCGLNYRGYDIAVLIEDVVTDYNHSEYPTFKMHKELMVTEEEENIIIRHYIINGGLGTTEVEIENEAKKLKGEVTACKIIFQLAGVLWGITTHDWSGGGFDENDCWRIEYARQRWENFLGHMHKHFGTELL